MTPPRHNGSLHQQLSSYQFPNREARSVVPEATGRPLRRKALSDSPHDSALPLASMAAFHTSPPPLANPTTHPLLPSLPPLPSYDHSASATLRSRIIDPQPIDRLSRTSDSLEAAMAAIDNLADRSLDTLPIPPSHTLSSSRPLSQLTMRTRKTSQALSRRVFHLPSSRPDTPVGTDYESETASRRSTDTDASFLLAAHAVAQQWPVPPRPQPQPRPRTKSTLSILRVS